MTSQLPVQGIGVKAVLFFDGECGLCDASVRFLLRIDRRSRLHFAPLQGSTAQEYLRMKNLPRRDFDSMVFVRDWPSREETAPLFRTDAALAALAEIGGPWRVFTIFRVVPRPLRDGVYRIIARLRYKLSGPAKHCPLPRPEWTRRFLP